MHFASDSPRSLRELIKADDLGEVIRVRPGRGRRGKGAGKCCDMDPNPVIRFPRGKEEMKVDVEFLPRHVVKGGISPARCISLIDYICADSVSQIRRAGESARTRVYDTFWSTSMQERLIANYAMLR